MEIQFHPASGSGKVRTLRLGPAGERWLAFLAAAAALLAASLLFTAPLAIARAGRREEWTPAPGRRAGTGASRERVSRLAREVRDRALDRADYLNRVAFLYGVPAARWPRPLGGGPGASDAGADRIAADVATFLPALEQGRAILEEREKRDPDLPARVPSVLPCAAALCEPASFFGPRTSPWTGEEEFFSGVDIAAPEGSAVLAPGGGTVVFAGKAPRSSTGWFWRLGNMIVLSHGASGATVFGHLSRIEARRGERVARGRRIGSVGATGWAISPRLHYEYWRPDGRALSPTDPLFAALDPRLDRKPVSLEQMEATSAPGPLDPLPGLGVPVSGSPGAPAAGSRPAPARRRRRT